MTFGFSRAGRNPLLLDDKLPQCFPLSFLADFGYMLKRLLYRLRITSVITVQELLKEC